MIVWLDLCPNQEDKLSLATAEYTPTWVLIDGKGLRVSNNDGASGRHNSQASYNHVSRLLPDNSIRELPNYLVEKAAVVDIANPWRYFNP